MTRHVLGWAFAVVMAIGSGSPAVMAVGTREQHSDWMRKFETPGGTYAHELSGAEGAEGFDLSQPTWCRTSAEISDLIHPGPNC